MSQHDILKWFQKRAKVKDFEPLTLTEIRESLNAEGFDIGVCSCNRQVLGLVKSGFIERIEPEGFEWKVKYRLPSDKK